MNSYKEIYEEKALLWSTKANETFEISRESLAKATLLAHPKINAELILFTDASNQNIEAALQQ